MELFRIIKSDAKRAMHFCGGRSVASAIIILLACLMINLAESALLLVFSEPGNIFENLYGNSPESIAVVSGMAFVWLLLIPALFLGYKKLHFSFAEGKDESISVLFDMFSSFKKFIGSFFFAFAYIIRYAVVFYSTANTLFGLFYSIVRQTYNIKSRQTARDMCFYCYYIPFYTKHAKAVYFAEHTFTPMYTY